MRMAPHSCQGDRVFFFLADNEDEMNDWLAKLNYAAAFRTSGVRMRGVVGGNYEGQRTRGIRRLDSHNESTKSVQTPTGEVTIISGKIDTKMANDILAARREIMLQKISDAEEKLTACQKQLDSQLRNARHLQILAPIQAKTRDQVLLAAGRMAAQLKWGRMEIWRLKCHRDILLMDLEEEKKVEGIHPKHEGSGEVPSVHRLNSKSSTLAPQHSPRSPPLPNTRPSTSSQMSPQPDDHGMEDIFQTPPLSSASSFHKAQASWELPPLNFDQRGVRKPSFSSAALASPNLAPAPSRGSSKPGLSSDTEPLSPGPDAAEQAVLEQSGLMNVNTTPDVKRSGTDLEAEDSKDQVVEKEKDSKDKLDRGKIRRSLHRTLREAHVPTHARSKKGKDSGSSTAMSDDKNSDDVLSRGTGSFVVHGKKASVITFGSELQSMSPDERLRLRRQPHKDGPAVLSPATIDDDFHSVLAEPFEYHERHGSTATAMSATERSFRDLRKNLTVPGSSNPAIIMSEDGDDSEAAISFSDGRRTPLPPVEDEDEDNDDSDGHLGIHTKQAMFYTPEASNSPTSVAFSERYHVNDEHDGMNDDTSSERLSTPPLQTAIAAA